GLALLRDPAARVILGDRPRGVVAARTSHSSPVRRRGRRAAAPLRRHSQRLGYGDLHRSHAVGEATPREGWRERRNRAVTAGRKETSDHWDGRRFVNPDGAAGQPFSKVPQMLREPRTPWPKQVDVVPRIPPPLDGAAAVVTFV